MKLSCPLGTTCRVKFTRKPNNKSYIDQAFSVNMAGFWPCSFFESLWTSNLSRSINMQKKNLANINLLLTEREGRSGEYWPEVVAVRTERSEVRTKTTEGQYSPLRLEQARLVSSLLYGTRVMLVSKLPAFENKKYTSYDHFHGNGPYGKIPTKKEPIRTPGFTSRLPCHIIISHLDLTLGQ